MGRYASYRDGIGGRSDFSVRHVNVYQRVPTGNHDKDSGIQWVCPGNDVGSTKIVTIMIVATMMIVITIIIMIIITTITIIATTISIIVIIAIIMKIITIILLK